MKEQKPETKAESAASFNKSKEYVPVKEKPYKYVETVYNYKDGTCRVIEPRYITDND